MGISIGELIIGGENMNNIINREELLKRIEKEKMILLYFGDDTCSVCVDMKPKVINILNKYNKIDSAFIGINKNLELAREFNIFTMPAILLYIEGKEAIREARYLSVQELEKNIDRYYNLVFDI